MSESIRNKAEMSENGSHSWVDSELSHIQGYSRGFDPLNALAMLLIVFNQAACWNAADAGCGRLLTVKQFTRHGSQQLTRSPRETRKTHLGHRSISPLPLRHGYVLMDAVEDELNTQDNVMKVNSEDIPVDRVFSEPDADGAVLNFEERVSVYYSGGAKSRERRVRRTRRPNREERWQLSPEPSGYRRMSAFCNVDSIDLERAIESIMTLNKYGRHLAIKSYTDVVHCRFFWKKNLTDAEIENMTLMAQYDIRDAFVFPYGSVVLWGFSSDEELEFLSSLEPCCEPLSLLSESSESEKVEELADSEFMLYEVVENKSDASGGLVASGITLSNNIIRLRKDDATEKLTISFAFAQSAKLSVFETALDTTIEEIRPIPVELAATGRSKFSANEVARLTGKVFLERNEVNLYSNILDTPDFFWEAEELEPLYRRVNRYLDIEDRVRILNGRLDIVNDLLESLSSQLEIRNSHRLEIIVIALIALEIILELVKEETSLPPFLKWPQRVLFFGAKLLGGGHG